jgi:hypothetical protein
VIPVFGEEMKHMNKPITVVVSSRAGGSLIRTRVPGCERTGRGARRLSAGLFAAVLSAVALMVLAPVAFAAPSRAYESSFGSLSEPEAVTVDQSTGDVYVVDTAAGTVSRFSAAGTPVEFSATKSNVLSGFIFESGAAEVAVAPAGSPGGTAGDIYVVSSITDNVEIFDANGNHVGELNGSNDANKGFSEACGVAVEVSTGAVYVGEFSGQHVWRYTPTTGTVTEANYTGGIETPIAVCGIAADGGNVYAGNTYSAGELLKYQASAFVTGAPPAPSGTLLDATATAVATDPSNGDVYVDEEERVSVFNSSGTSLYTFGSSTDFGTSSAGVGVMGSNGKAFVADRVAGQVDVFASAANLPPIATTSPASTIHHTDAVLNGHLAPGTDSGGATDPVTACHFDWGTDTKYTGGTVPCNEGNSFTTAANVTANLGNLTPGVTIHYRLHITGATSGEATGGDETLTPPHFPVVYNPLTSFGQDGTSATTFPGNDRLAFLQGSQRLYVLAKGSPGIFAFDASSPPSYPALAGFTPLSTAATGDDPALTVDNTGLSSAGNIYYVSENTGGGVSSGTVFGFNTAGAALGGNFPIDPAVNPGAPAGSPKDICGAAVDSAGDLWVSNFETNSVLKYSSTGVFQGSVSTAAQGGPQGGPCQLAFDSANNLYVAMFNGPTWKYTAASDYTTSTPIDSGKAKAIAVDQSTGDLYVAHETIVDEYSSGILISEFAANVPGASYRGITVDETNHDVYISDQGNNVVRVFAPGSVVKAPTLTQGDPSSVTGSLATLHAKVDPETFAVTDCHFDYGTTTAYGQSVPCSPAPGGGSGDVAVSAALSGLHLGTVYHFRIVAVNANDESTGGDQTFTTLSTVITEAASGVGVSEATLNGSVNPEGVAVTACEFEYGVTASYGKAVPCATDPGTGNVQTSVSATVTGLQLTTTYHYRLRSSSGGIEAHGADRMFATVSPRDFVGAGLPDGRVYELVTNPDGGDAEVYEPEAGGAYSSIKTRLPFQASVGGGAVAFVGSPGVGGNEDAGEGSGNEYVARRSGDGVWVQGNISPVGFPSGVFEGFSDDLSVGFLDSIEPMAASAPGFGEANLQGGNYDVLYSTSTATDGGYVPLLTTSPPYRSRLDFGTFGVGHESLPKARQGNERVLMYAGASADSSHVLFEANDALTPGAEGGSAAHYKEENNLYEYADGQLRLVNVLPDNSTKANASFGAPNFESNLGSGAGYASPDFSHVISNDGSRVFWTDLNTGHIYMRENGTSTVEISSGGKFWAATPDGSKVFYTNGDLYEYDVGTGHTTDLTPGVTVQGVIGTSEDGTYVYYVTAGFDLDLWHNGATSMIKTLSAKDNGTGSEGIAGFNFAGDWRPGYGNRMAEVSPDGHGVVFMSTNGESGETGKNTGRVDVYDADNGRLYCASCGSPGSQGFVPLTFSNTYLKRWISADGSRVFFDSKEALVPRDTNGKLDVYEWERPGSGTCKASTTGCIYLLSGGTSGGESYLADASANGNDVFVVTRAKLLSRDDNELYDLYDVRAGGSEPVSVPQCTGTGCQGLPGSPPIFATPSSVTFAGTGNFAAPAPVVKIKPKPKPKKKAGKKKPKPKHRTGHGRAKKGAKANSGHAGNGRNGARRSSGKGGRS